MYENWQHPDSDNSSCMSIEQNDWYEIGMACNKNQLIENSSLIHYPKILKIGKLHMFMAGQGNIMSPTFAVVVSVEFIKQLAFHGRILSYHFLWKEKWIYLNLNSNRMNL